LHTTSYHWVFHFEIHAQFAQKPTIMDRCHQQNNFWVTISIHLKFKVDICTMQQVKHQWRPIQDI
jgi:hypothetical protein